MKKENLRFIQSSKQLLIALCMACVLSSALAAQNTETYKNFINKTAVAVREAQKTMIATNKTDVDGKLSQLVALQMDAVNLFSKKDYARAACYSNAARQAALALIGSSNEKRNEFYKVTEEEKKLFAALKETLPLQANPAPSVSTKDQDYLTPGTIERHKIEVQ